MGSGRICTEGDDAADDGHEEPAGEGKRAFGEAMGMYAALEVELMDALEEDEEGREVEARAGETRGNVVPEK